MREAHDLLQRLEAAQYGVGSVDDSPELVAGIKALLRRLEKEVRP